MFYCISFVIYFCSMLYVPALCDFCLTRRWKRLPGWAYIAIFCLAAVIPAYRKFISTERNLETQICYDILIGLFFAQVFVMYRDAIWKKLCVFCFLVIIPLLAETTTVFFFKQIPGFAFKTDYATMETAMMVAMTTFLVIVLTALLMIPWLRLTSQTKLPRKILLVFGVLFLGQILLLDYCGIYAYLINDKKLILAICIGVLISLIGNYCELRYTLNQNEQERCRRELSELTNQWKIEKQQYEQLEHRTDEVSRFRHDARNRMSVITELIEEGKIDKALEVCQKILEQ